MTGGAFFAGGAIALSSAADSNCRFWDLTVLDFLEQGGEFTESTVGLDTERIGLWIED